MRAAGFRYSTSVHLSDEAATAVSAGRPQYRARAIAVDLEVFKTTGAMPLRIPYSYHVQGLLVPLRWPGAHARARIEYAHIYRLEPATGKRVVARRVLMQSVLVIQCSSYKRSLAFTALYALYAYELRAELEV